MDQVTTMLNLPIDSGDKVAYIHLDLIRHLVFSADLNVL